MDFLRRRSRTFWAMLGAATCAWVALAARAVHIRYRDPFGPSADHPGYGENLPGDLATVLIWGAVELAVLVFVLGPWSRRYLIARTGATTIVYGYWTLFAGLAGMHAGTVWNTLVLWRFPVVGILLLTFLVLVLRWTVRRVAAG